MQNRFQYIALLQLLSAAAALMAAGAAFVMTTLGSDIWSAVMRTVIAPYTEATVHRIHNAAANFCDQT